MNSPFGEGHSIATSTMLGPHPAEILALNPRTIESPNLRIGPLAQTLRNRFSVADLGSVEAKVANPIFRMRNFILRECAPSDAAAFGRQTFALRVRTAEPGHRGTRAPRNLGIPSNAGTPRNPGTPNRNFGTSDRNPLNLH